MRNIKNMLRVSVLYLAAIVLAVGTPMTAFAEESGEPPETYTYNPATGRWDSSKWRYDPATNTYVPQSTPIPTPPPAPAETVTPGVTEETNASNAPQAADAADGSATASSTLDADASTQINNSTNINNTLDSDAKTGDAKVNSNTTAGSAGSGNASADATVINTVHSTVQGDTAGIAHFTADINGDITGDITIGPAIKNATASTTTTINSDTDITNNNSITNNLNLNAQSGNAEVSDNTNAGDATSGNADAVVNVLNLINTIIAANKSFVGTINIHGNLNGDILISPEFIPQLLGSNATTSNLVDTSLSATLNDNQAIINNIKLNAESGTATVANNNTAGTAQTGTANTNLTVLNLTGREVNASNSLLVFVNVLGTWVGMIVDAPGATAAALGNGVIENKTTINGDLTATNNSQITNNIDLSAQTGNASVTGNTNAGNATTGNATASANIANISTSTFNISDWFGVLFINVFGTWYGSFGVDTEAGTLVALGGDAVPQPEDSLAPSYRFGFNPQPAPKATPAKYTPPVISGPASEDVATPQLTPAQVELVSAQLPDKKDAVEHLLPQKTTDSGAGNAIMMAIGSLIAGAGAVTGLSNGRRGFFGIRKNKNQ